MRWFEQKEILSYIVDCYQGVDGTKRQFIWEEANGDIVIGNTRAFYDHMAERFGLHATKTGWMAVHVVLHELGEVVQEHAPKSKQPRRVGQKYQEPEIRVLRKGGR